MGMGSRTIKLPVRPSVPAVEVLHLLDTPRAAAPASTSLERPLNDVHVMVVDDDADARDLIEALLRTWGAKVETASSASQALELVQRLRPHVLVSDIAMPDVDGYELMRRIRALEPALGGGIPSIALTAHARAEDETQALSVGFTTHIGKPVRADDLLTTVENLAHSSPQRPGELAPSRRTRSKH